MDAFCFQVNGSQQQLRNTNAAEHTGASCAVHLFKSIHDSRWKERYTEADLPSSFYLKRISLAARRLTTRLSLRRDGGAISGDIRVRHTGYASCEHVKLTHTSYDREYRGVYDG